MTLVSDGSVYVLVDAGLPCKEMEIRLASRGVRPGTIEAILLSHEHHDHTRGASQFARKHRVPLYSTEGTFRILREDLHRSVEWLRLRAGETHKLCRLAVEVFPTPHDAREPVGFRFRRGKLAFAHVTDLGHLSRPVEEALEASQVVLVESNHDLEMLRRGPYPESIKRRVASRHGHLSNEALARYLESRLPDYTHHLFLAHLSQTNNHETLALSSARTALERRGGPLPAIHVTYQDRPTRLLRVREPRAIPSVDEAQGVLEF